MFADPAKVASLQKLSPDARKAAMQKYFGEYMGQQTREAVLKHWNDGSKAGTLLHLDIERYLNGLEPKLVDSVEWQQFHTFLTDHPGLEWFRSEWRIFDPDVLLSGSVDATVVKRRDPVTGKVTHIDILDWYVGSKR